MSWGHSRTSRCSFWIIYPVILVLTLFLPAHHANSTNIMDNTTVISSTTPTIPKKLNSTQRSPGGFRLFANLAECVKSLGKAAIVPADGALYCNATWDGVLCWPVARANSTISQPCPPLRGVDPSKLSFKTCWPDGHWAGSHPGDYARPQGWTDYAGCYTPGALKIYYKLFNKTDSIVMKEIAHGVRIMEIVGLCLSLVSLSISLFIFFYFRSLKCDRTRIHRNLFMAIMIHVLIQLIRHVDQSIAKNSGSAVGGTTIIDGGKGTIYNTPILCEALNTMVEYTKTVMFVWMFIEGMYLHNMLVISVFTGRPKYVLFYILGWGSPVILTLTWAITNGFLDGEQCWSFYSFKPQYWILEGPRAAIIAVNLLFLLNIVRVLVTKLRESHSNEAEQVRKAVKAAIVLLPLLGVNNFLAMVEFPTGNAVKFAVYSYTSQFLSSFQGFFIALLYCFLNAEVRQTVRLHWDRYQQRHGRYTSGRRGTSGNVSIFTSVTEVPTHQIHRIQSMSMLNGQRYLVRPENGETTL